MAGSSLLSPRSIFESVLAKVVVGLIIAALGGLIQFLTKQPSLLVPTWLVVFFGLLPFPLGWFYWKSRHHARQIEVLEDGMSAVNKIRDQVRTKRLLVEQCDLIQHSSEDAQPLVKALLNAGTKTNLRLFVQDPETAAVLWPGLVHAIDNRLASYYREVPQDYAGRVCIYRYKTPAAFNGIRLELADGTKLLLVSWYLSASKGSSVTFKNMYFRVTKHNPCLLVKSNHPDFAHINDFFDRVVESAIIQETQPITLPTNATYQATARDNKSPLIGHLFQADK